MGLYPVDIETVSQVYPPTHVKIYILKCSPYVCQKALKYPPWFIHSDLFQHTHIISNWETAAAIDSRTL